MKRIRKSFGHALDGLIHAFQLERNLQLFLPVYVLILILGGIVRLLTWEWLALIIAGAVFLTIELLNTAIERLTDVLDEERKLLGRKAFHAKMKATKDVAASAALVAFVALIAVTVVVFWPYAEMYVVR